MVAGRLLVCVFAMVEPGEVMVVKLDGLDLTPNDPNEPFERRGSFGVHDWML